MGGPVWAVDSCIALGFRPRCGGIQEHTYAFCHLRSCHSPGDRGHHGHGRPWCRGPYHCGPPSATWKRKVMDEKPNLPVRAARAVAGVAAVTVVIPVAVTIAPIILTRGVIAAARAGRPTARRTTRSTVPIAAVKPPRSRRRRASPLQGYQHEGVWLRVFLRGLTSIFRMSSRPMRLLCISW